MASEKNIPLTDNEGHKMRLEAISDYKKELEEARDKRESLYNKYHRVGNILDTIDNGLVSASASMSIAGAVLLSLSVVAPPVGIGFIVGTVITGTLGVIGKFMSKKIAAKANKHKDIKVLAASKLDTISDHVSSALKDGHISDAEYKLIKSEIPKYREMKAEIQAKAEKKYESVTISNEEKSKVIDSLNIRKAQST